MNIFEAAARGKFRYLSAKGSLTTEQLWDLTLTDLDATARHVNANLKSVTEDSFIETAKPDPRKAVLEAQLEVLKFVIADKQAAIAKAAAARSRREERARLLDALSVKEAQELSAASKDDILKKLTALDAED